ncbi:MAG TPA: hypothetical protein VGO28_02350 [Acidimicrobiia bacterium]
MHVSDEEEGDPQPEPAVGAHDPTRQELRSKLQNIPFDDGSRLQDLGDEAYVDKFDSVIAVSGTTVMQAKLQNYQGASSRFRRVSEGAVRAALPRLGS